MTYFLDFRTSDVGGSPTFPRLLYGNGAASPLLLTLVEQQFVPSHVNAKNLLFATHGFNVSRQQGALAMNTLDRYLDLSPPDLLLGVLWPGDAWIPVVDYPLEGNVAITCGQFMASFCNSACAGAQSLSFLSHSLGARVVLEAMMHLDRADVRSVCLTAAAINRDALVGEYRFVPSIADRISLLASHSDDVLKLAFTVGDPFADLLHDDHSPFQPALGSDGPPLPAISPITQPWQIPDRYGYGHGDYLPGLPPPAVAKWQKAADFMRRSFFGQPQTWPSA